MVSQSTPKQASQFECEDKNEKKYVLCEGNCFKARIDFLCKKGMSKIAWCCPFNPTMGFLISISIVLFFYLLSWFRIYFAVGWVLLLWPCGSSMIPSIQKGETLPLIMYLCFCPWFIVVCKVYIDVYPWEQSSWIQQD